MLRISKSFIVSFGFALAATVACCVTAQASTLEKVRERGYINCGVDQDEGGFAAVDSSGRWSGLDIEFCSALSAAVLGDSSAVKFRSIPPMNRFTALRNGDVDVLPGTASWTFSRDTELGARFAGILFHDGQGFLVPRSHAVASVMELSGASICVLQGSGGERSVSDFFVQSKMRLQLVTSEKWEELVKTYATGGCTALTGDMSVLARERVNLSNPTDHLILPEIITKEPRGPSVSTQDDSWFAIVRWALMALISAEELGITRDNVDAMKDSLNINVRRFLGLETDLGTPLGLARDWTYQIIKQVGSYGEIYDRTLGPVSPLRLDRGLNNTWLKGGLLYSPPFR